MGIKKNIEVIFYISIYSQIKHTAIKNVSTDPSEIYAESNLES